MQGTRGKNIHQGVEPCQVRTVGRVTCVLPKPSSPLVFFQYCPLLESLPASQAPYVSSRHTASSIDTVSGCIWGLCWLSSPCLPLPGRPRPFILQPPFYKVTLCQLTCCLLASPHLSLPFFPHRWFFFSSCPLAATWHRDLGNLV